MAQRRMFSLKVIDTDDFLDMPASTRLLYYDLSMRADDDGFVSAPKKIIRMTGASNDDLKILTSKGFLIPFESGVCVIRHWRVHNYIQKDRYTETMYKEEFNRLKMLENGDYSLMDTKCVQGVHEMLPQVRLGKDRLEIELEKGKDIKDKENYVAAPPRHDADSLYYKCALYMRSKILEINPNAKIPKEDPASMDKWSDDIRKIVELDKRDIEDLRELVGFIYKVSDFWGGVVLSPSNLRKNWDKIYAQMKRPAKSNGKNGNVISFKQQMDVLKEWAEEG